MSNGFSEAMLKQVGEAIKRGDIPPSVSNEWLWAGMILRSQEEGKKAKKLDRLTVSVGVLTGTLIIYGGVLFVMAEALLKHLNIGG